MPSPTDTPKPDRSGALFATAAEIAERWGCSVQHVRNLIARGKLTAFSLGGAIRVRLSDVDAFEAASLIVAATPPPPKPPPPAEPPASQARDGRAVSAPRAAGGRAAGSSPKRNRLVHVEPPGGWGTLEALGLMPAPEGAADAKEKPRSK
jgi:excisionase family DNA binding protein